MGYVGWMDYSTNVWLEQVQFKDIKSSTIVLVIVFHRYVPEGNMTACGTDYLSRDILSVSYIVAYAIFVYFLPLFLIIYSYWFIVQVSVLICCCYS